MFLLLLQVALAAVLEVNLNENGFESSQIDLRIGDSLIIRGSPSLSTTNVRQVSSMSSCSKKEGVLDFDSNHFKAGHTMVDSFDTSGTFYIASTRSSDFCHYLTIRVKELPTLHTMDMQNIRNLMLQSEGGSVALKPMFVVLALLLI